MGDDTAVRDDQSQLYNPWDDLDLWKMCSAEGKSANANNLTIDECPYGTHSAERAAWMDGFDNA